MTDLDRQIRATLQTLVALQGAKIIQVERDAAKKEADKDYEIFNLKRRIHVLEAKLNEKHTAAKKVEVQA